MGCRFITPTPTGSAAIEAPLISDSLQAHNLYMAEMDYGKEKMDQHRRSADRVRESSPSNSSEDKKPYHSLTVNAPSERRLRRAR